MAEDFDPYRKWLGIPPAEQPPHHYRLLGIGMFERDPDVIEGAADRQMAHVQTYKTGPHSATSQKILNELAAAKICLLQPEKRAAYDAELRTRLEKSRAPARLAKAITGAPAPAVVVQAARPSSAKYARNRKRSQQGVYLVGGAVAAVLIVGAAVVMALRGGGGAEQVAQGENGGEASVSNGGPSAGSGESQPQPGESSPGHASSERAAERSNPRTQAPVERAGRNGSSESASSSDSGDDADGQARVPVRPPREEPDADPPDDEPPTQSSESDDPPADDSAEPNEVESPEDSQPRRAAPPDEATVAAVGESIRETFQDDFDRAQSDEAAKAALADKLFRQGADPEEKPDNRYVLLSEGLRLAVESGRLTLALGCIDALAADWEVDPIAQKWEALSAMSKAPHPAEAAHELADALLTLVDEAIAAGDFETTDRIAGLAKGEAGKSRDADLRKLATERDGAVQRLLKEYRAAQEAEALLASDADDPEANLVVGRFRCFVLDDWAAGLPLLIKGGDERLAQLAALETESSDEPADQLRLADGWWDLAEAANGADAEAFQKRARHWYERALPKLAGVDKLRAEKRLEPEAESAAETAAAPTDLHLTRALSRVRKALDDAKLARTAPAGRTDRGEAFEDLPREAGLLAGFTITLRGPADRRTVSSIQPLYLTAGGVVPGTARGRVDRNPVQIQAQEGYAVAGVTVRGRNYIEGLSVTFMKIKNGQLNPKDNYTSEWYGATAGTLVPIAGTAGKPVVGIFGLAGDNEVNALGLTHLP